MEAGPNPYLFSSDSSIERTDRKTTVLPLGPREPVFIYEEVYLEESKKNWIMMNQKIDGLLHEILFDFNISATDENIKWLRKQIDELVLSYENSYNVKLPAATRAMVYKLIVRMAYDRFSIKSST